MAGNDDLVRWGKATVTALRPAKDTAKDPTKFGDLVLKNISDAQNAPPREYIVKGLLGVGEMSVVCGPPKCGKSFATLHVAYAVSQGRQVWGRRVKQRTVLYVALEGESGFAKRLRAQVLTYGASKDIHYIAQPVPLFDRPEQAQDIIAAALHVKAGLIVIDTHARAMTGGDENQAKDTGGLVGLYDEIRHATGAHLLVIHHTGKDAERGGRGSTALPAAADAWLGVAKDEAAGSHALEVKLSKDDASGDALNFKLAVIEIGEPDEDGDPVTTCIVEELDAVRIDAKAAKRPRLTHEQQGDYAELVNLFAAADSPAIQTRPAEGMQIQRVVTRQQLREHWERTARLLRNDDGNASLPNGTVRKALFDKIKRLKDKGFIGTTPEYVWLIGGERYDAQ